MKLLIVEDDLLLQEGLAMTFGQEGYVLDIAATGAEADSFVRSATYGLIILDLGLPDQDGARLLRQWRQQGVESPLELSVTPEDAGVMLVIYDQGPGIAEEHRHRLTQPFQRLDQRYGGSGLGLSLVQRIVQLHRGTLTLDNQPDKKGLIARCWFPDPSL